MKLYSNEEKKNNFNNKIGCTMREIFFFNLNSQYLIEMNHKFLNIYLEIIRIKNNQIFFSSHRHCEILDKKKL